MTPDCFLDSHAPDLLALLRSLVSIPTVNPPGDHYETMTALLVREMQASGLRARRIAIPRTLLKRHLPPAQHAYPRYNVLGVQRVPGAKRTIHFNAHYDVVPVSGEWRHGSAFSGEVERGWIYGRGTADMKGSIAALLFALRALRATGTAPRTHVEVSFTADEETDSVLGTEWVVNHGGISPDYAVVMEGGEGARVCCGHNGVVWLNVTVHGRAAHGSQPQHGINALEKMSALVLALEDYKRTLTRRPFLSPEGITMIPTLNVGGVFTAGPGGKINTVPALASFSIDRRVIANETAGTAERELRDFLRSAARTIPQCRITIEKVSENHPCFHAPTHPFLAAMADCVRTVRKAPTVFSVSPGFNDMCFFARNLRVPTVGYGPQGQSMHAVDERARVKDLLNSARIYAKLLTTFAG